MGNCGCSTNYISITGASTTINIVSDGINCSASGCSGFPSLVFTHNDPAKMITIAPPNNSFKCTITYDNTSLTDSQAVLCSAERLTSDPQALNIIVTIGNDYWVCQMVFMFFDDTIVSVKFTNLNWKYSNLSSTLPPSTTPTTITCTPPQITIFASMSNITNDVSEVQYTVYDCLQHKCGLGKYQGFTQSNIYCTTNTTNTTNINSNNFSITNKISNKNKVSCNSSTTECFGTIFYVIMLEIGPAVVGSDTLSFAEKTTALGLADFTRLLEYALVKIILGRLLFCEIDIKWLLRSKYEELLNKVSESIYANFFTYLVTNSQLNNYFKVCFSEL